MLVRRGDFLRTFSLLSPLEVYQKAIAVIKEITNAPHSRLLGSKNINKILSICNMTCNRVIQSCALLTSASLDIEYFAS